jgi:glycerol-3-phosphate acyltransferase PlsX
MKIVVDILGGDSAPKATLDGAINVLKRNSAVEMVLVGEESFIAPAIAKAGVAGRVEIIHTAENLSCEEAPTAAIRKYVNSSMVLGLNALKMREDCSAFVSAGSTGALLTGAFMKLGRVEGVSRPALCPLMPTRTDGVRVMLVDAGANVDCKPVHLVHFALMGNVYMKALGIKNPRVALVNVGTEHMKGNELTHTTHDALQALHERGVLNFVGNMEARDAFSGNYDILVADGFVGNVLLKSAEGAVSFIGEKVSKVCHSGYLQRIGGALVSRGLNKMKARFSEDSTGGSPFLGIKKPVIKAHGNSSAKAFENAILCAITAAEMDLREEIRAVIADNSEAIEQLTADKN